MSGDSVFGIRIKYHGKEAALNARNVGEEVTGASMDTIRAAAPRFHLADSPTCPLMLRKLMDAPANAP